MRLSGDSPGLHLYPLHWCVVGPFSCPATPTASPPHSPTANLSNGQRNCPKHLLKLGIGGGKGEPELGGANELEFSVHWRLFRRLIIGRRSHISPPRLCGGTPQWGNAMVATPTKTTEILKFKVKIIIVLTVIQVSCDSKLKLVGDVLGLQWLHDTN